MADVNELKQQASELRKQKAYQEASEIFKILWEEHRDQCNEWDGWGYAYSLRKLGNISLACEVSIEVYEKWPEFEHIRSLSAWCIYDTEIKKDIEEIKQSESNFFEAVNKIINLVAQDKYSPLSLTIFKVVDYLEKSKNNYSAEFINNWLERLNPEGLSLETWTGKDQRGRTVEHASDKEKWFVKKAKVLYEMGRFQECIDTSQKALSVIPVFHYRNDKWIKRLISLSYYALGEYEEGLGWLNQIMDHQPEWFLYQDKARFLSQLGDKKEALRHAAIAALDPQQLGFKWNLFFEIGKILLDQGEIDLAKEHLTLAYKVRLENEWSIPEDLQNFLEKASVDIPDEIDTHKLERKLREYWQSLQVADLKKMTGTIKNLVGEGKSGFISGKDGMDYYFQVKNFKGDARQLQPGRDVSFYIKPTDQPGKRDTAVNLELI
jgi:tetratricopeptide (TPR) repeat protein/cold shock CspA family protein